MDKREVLEAAKRELARRRLARSSRTSLLDFVSYTMPKFSVSDHHRVLCAALERVAKGELKRLIVMMPPRHGKSEIASRRFPAWYLGAYPDRQIIAASYNSELASDFGRDVRNIVAGEEYADVFETKLAADSQSANRWHTSAGGSYVSAGIGTAITGRGAHCLLLDDPIKDREEADSQVSRQRVWDWYTSTAYTRLMPGGAVILIQTRWHTDDLAGRLMVSQERFGGDVWEVISLPALDSGGKALWPAWYSEEDLARIRTVIGPRDWSALYMQTPLPDGRGEFNRQWLRWYDGVLTGSGMNTYIVVDPAGAKKLTSDRTAMWVVGLNSDGNYYVLDAVYDRLNLAERVRELMRLHRKYKPMRVGYEKYGKDSDIEALKMIQERENYRFDVQELGGRLRKEDRVRRLIPFFEQSRIYLPSTLFKTDFEGRTIDVIEQFLVEEYDRFPVGKHDDGLDCLARILDDDLHAYFPSGSQETHSEWRKQYRRAAGGSAWAM